MNHTLRVAHVLRKYDPREWGGTETAVRDLMNGLRTQNVESVVYAPSLETNDTTAGDPLRSDGFDVHRFRAFLPVVGIRENERQSLISIGGNIVSFDAPWQLYRDRKIDVLHTHALGRLGGLTHFVSRQRGIPLVVTIHGGYMDLPADVADKLAAPTRHGFDYGKIFGFFFQSRRLLEYADAVITVNAREAELLQAKYPDLRVEIIPHGVPALKFDANHRAAALEYLPQIQGRTMILCVGRIDPVKNQAFLVDCFPEIRRYVPNAMLVLVGPTTDAAHEHRIRARIRELGLENSILLPGSLRPYDPRLIGLYQSAHVFVLPSSSETFGLVLLEAWAAGCPVIASATSGAKQIVRDGENGFLFPINDSRGLLDAMKRTFVSEEHRRSLGRTGKTMVQTHYDNRAIARRVRHLYAELHANARNNPKNPKVAS
jgi:alpha-maltose-1-phosphate synthase